MPLHHDSLPLIEYVKNVSEDLIAPLEDIGWELWESGDDPVDGHQIILTSLLLVGTKFAIADGKLSGAEVDFLADVLTLINSGNPEDSGNFDHEAKQLLRLVLSNISF